MLSSAICVGGIGFDGGGGASAVVFDREIGCMMD